MTQKPWIATILTTEEKLPDRQGVLNALKKVSGYETQEFELISEDDVHFVFRTRSAMLAVTLTDAVSDPEANSTPLSVLKKSCFRAWHWAEAAMSVSQASRQVLAAVLPDDDALEPLDAALLLTALTSSVLKVMPTNGVYWNNSGMVHEPLSFMQHAVGMNRLAIPVELWIEFRLYLNSDLSLSIGTWGMNAFGLAELEVSRSRRDSQWLLRWLFNLAHLMLENGPLDTDMEHTFGRSDQEKFRLTYARSAPEIERDSIDEILNVQFEAADKN